MYGDCPAQIFLGLVIWCLFELAREVEIIPADDGVFDQAIAGLGYLQFFFLDLRELTRIAYSDSTGEAVGQFHLVELAFDRLPEVEIIDIAQNEQGFDDLPECFQGLVKRVLPRIGIQPPEDIGRGVFLELDCCDQTQERIPVFSYQGLINGLVRSDSPVSVPDPIWLEDIEGLPSNAFDTWSKRKSQKMRHAKDGLIRRFVSRSTLRRNEEETLITEPRF